MDRPFDQLSHGVSALVGEHKRRAGLLIQTGEATVAVNLLEEVLPKARKDPELLFLLGIAHRMANNPTGAIRHLSRLTQLQPAHISGWCALSGCHSEIGQLRKAHQALDRVFAFAPDQPQALALKAKLLESHGHPQQAFDLLSEHRKKVTSRNGSVEAAFCELCLNLGRHAEGIDAARAQLGRADMPPTQRQPMLTQLGHLLDAVGDYDDAFDAYNRSNLMSDEVKAANPETVRRYWSRELLDRVGPIETRTNLPVLIVGMPRSGTTLTDQIITSHPRAGGVGESSFLSDMAKGRTPASITPEWCAQLGQDYQGVLRRKGGEKSARITDKMPENYLMLGLASRSLPGARVIHCTRDARDVVLSCFFQNFGPARLKWSRRLETCARQYLAYTEVMSYWREVLGDDLSIMDSPYADLTSEPEPSVRALLGHIGLEYDPACLDFHKSKRSVTTASVAQVRRPLYQTSRNRWKNYEKHIGTALEILQDV